MNGPLVITLEGTGQVQAEFLDRAQRESANPAPPCSIGRWARLVRRLEQSERGYIWLDKLGPAYLFGLVALLKIWGLLGREHVLTGSTDLLTNLVTAYQLASAAFFGLVAGLYLARRRPLRRVGSPGQAVVALVGSFVMLPVALGGTRTDSPPLVLTAVLLMLVGTCGAAIALGSLGRCFGIMPEARGLVTRGPYRFVRHPMYLAEFVAFLGIILGALSAMSLVLYAVFVACQLLRMRHEEQTLCAVFPSEYRAYQRQTARLIPGLY